MLNKFFLKKLTQQLIIIYKIYLFIFLDLFLFLVYSDNKMKMKNLYLGDFDKQISNCLSNYLSKSLISLNVIYHV